MKDLYLYNTAHPLAESGRPIFIPFGEWDHDDTCRQRLDRAHGEKIANELNARVARGEPGIPVYQGHPDVPALAAKYPDKGALGWVTKIELANEMSAHRSLLLDQAIAEGRISVAGRAAWEKRLANEKPLKQKSAVEATPGEAANVDLVALANGRMAKHSGMNYPAAFAQVMKEHPEVK
jgi:hypothetical protein